MQIDITHINREISLNVYPCHFSIPYEDIIFNLITKIIVQTITYCYFSRWLIWFHLN